MIMRNGYEAARPPEERSRLDPARLPTTSSLPTAPRLGMRSSTSGPTIRSDTRTSSSTTPTSRGHVTGSVTFSCCRSSSTPATTTSHTQRRGRDTSARICLQQVSTRRPTKRIQDFFHSSNRQAFHSSHISSSRPPTSVSEATSIGRSPNVCGTPKKYLKWRSWLGEHSDQEGGFGSVRRR